MEGKSRKKVEKGIQCGNSLQKLQGVHMDANYQKKKHLGTPMDINYVIVSSQQLVLIKL